MTCLVGFVQSVNAASVSLTNVVQEWRFTGEELVNGLIPSLAVPVNNNTLRVLPGAPLRLIELPLGFLPSIQGQKYEVEMSLRYSFNRFDFLNGNEPLDEIPLGSPELGGITIGLESEFGPSVLASLLRNDLFLGHTQNPDPSIFFAGFGVDGQFVNTSPLVGEDGDFGISFRFEIEDSNLKFLGGDAGGVEFVADPHAILNFDNTGSVNVVIGDGIRTNFELGFLTLGELAVTVTAVPEPSTTMLSALGVFALLRRRKR